MFHPYFAQVRQEDIEGKKKTAAKGDRIENVATKAEPQVNA
jgi:hypothetical protein